MKRQMVWAVECRIHDDDPAQFGPYTQRQAERIARKIRDEVALSTDSFGGIHHPSGIENAIAFPMGRFEDNIGWMTKAERVSARSAVREENEHARYDAAGDDDLGHLETR